MSRARRARVRHPDRHGRAAVPFRPEPGEQCPVVDCPTCGTSFALGAVVRGTGSIRFTNWRQTCPRGHDHTYDDTDARLEPRV